MASKQYVVMDGNTAAAHTAYAFTEVAGIYPITPSTVDPNRFFRPLADHSSTFSAMGEDGVMG